MFVAVTVFAFVTFHVVPGNPALRGLPAGASQADVRNRERLLGVDRPLPEQYGDFLWRIIVFAALCVIVLNLFVDTAYSVIDPRVRLKD